MRFPSLIALIMLVAASVFGVCSPPTEKMNTFLELSALTASPPGSYVATPVPIDQLVIVAHADGSNIEFANSQYGPTASTYAIYQTDIARTCLRSRTNTTGPERYDFAVATYYAVDYNHRE